jgi:AbrB family looped-hinge helix DNA binding protein
MPQTAAPKYTVSVGPQGRLVVPSPLRQELGISPGDTLLACVEDSRLVLEKRETVIERLRGRFAHLPAHVQLSEELIADRRAEARHE